MTGLRKAFLPLNYLEYLSMCQFTTGKHALIANLPKSFVCSWTSWSLTPKVATRTWYLRHTFLSLPWIENLNLKTSFQPPKVYSSPTLTHFGVLSPNGHPKVLDGFCQGLLQDITPIIASTLVQSFMSMLGIIYLDKFMHLYENTETWKHITTIYWHKAWNLGVWDRQCGEMDAPSFRNTTWTCWRSSKNKMQTLLKWQYTMYHYKL